MTQSSMMWQVRRQEISAVLAVLMAAGFLLGIAPARAAFPGANGKIAFETTRDGNLEIYSMAPDGSGQVNLTNDTRGDTDPVWSADGTRIAFVRATAHGDIWVMNEDGSGQINLTPDPNDGQGNAGINPTWSPDNRIAYADSHEIWAMNADGSGKTNLTNTPATEAVETLPAWSPDGTKIAFIMNFDVWVMNSDGSGRTRLTSTTGAGTAERWPNWSPDGTKIVYDRSGQAWVMNADGSNQTALTGGLGESGEQPAFSPDGTKIVFHSNAFDAPNGDDIFVMNADGTGVTRLPTAVPPSDNDPDWQAVALPPAEHALTVTKAGAGTGTVTSAPAGIQCGTDCSETYVEGTIVELTATPDVPNSSFTGWGGDCAGETGNTCTLTMDQAKSVTATFGSVDPGTNTLTVTVAGQGTVTSTPAGISCGANTANDCSQSYPAGQVVTLKATQIRGWAFAGWSGDCAFVRGNFCRVTMTSAKSVTATFTAN